MKKFLIFLGMMLVGASYADTETVSWYKDGAVYDTTTCQTGGDIIVPTAPTKRGYVFNGWVFGYDFSTINYLDWNCNFSSDNVNKTWTNTNIDGIKTLYGIALCSVTQTYFAQTNKTPDETTDNGVSCWCKATGFKPIEQNIIFQNTRVSQWVGRINYDTASGCNSLCTHECASSTAVYSNFRRALFGITQ